MINHMEKVDKTSKQTITKTARIVIENYIDSSDSDTPAQLSSSSVNISHFQEELISLLEQGHYQQIIQKTCLNKKKEKPILLYYQGLAYEKMRSWNMSFQCFQSASKLFGNLQQKQECLMKMGELCERQKQWTRALEYYYKYVAEKGPLQIEIMCKIANILKYQKQSQKSLEMYIRAMEMYAARNDIKKARKVMCDNIFPESTENQRVEIRKKLAFLKRKKEPMFVTNMRSLLSQKKYWICIAKTLEHIRETKSKTESAIAQYFQ